MSQYQNNNKEESEIKKAIQIFIKYYRLFVICLCLALGLAFLVNKYSIPVYKISSSILIKGNESRDAGGNVNDFINTSLFGKNQNFQNELWVLKSSPVVEKTIDNLNLKINYFQKKGFQYLENYQDVPFKVLLLPDHPQPVNLMFHITFIDNNSFLIKAKSKHVGFYNFEKNALTHKNVNWNLEREGKIGELIQSPDFAFIISDVSFVESVVKDKSAIYAFQLRTADDLRDWLKSNLEYKVVDKLATVIEINFNSRSVSKGIDIVNEVMDVYSEQNLERKNHIANITVEYIEGQLSEISDSLSQTENNLQTFRSSNQLLDITEQATGISNQYLSLQNQLAELTTRLRYYSYVYDYIQKNADYSNIIVPASLGIQDPLLGNLMSELISAQAQKNALIKNNQERNPLIQKLNIQIENIKKTISENISAVERSTKISVEEMNKRIEKTEAQISRLPETQRKLGSIERKYRLNDAIFNYLLQKRAEAKITKASNLPDNIIIEPARMVGLTPISPNKQINYLIALFLGLALPFGYILLKNELNERIENQEDIQKITSKPLLGKIMTNRLKTKNILHEFPRSTIAESFRALRTNLDFFVKGLSKKVIMITSCLENEGKSFIALNLAMSYAQLGKRTILVNFDLRKPETYFNEGELSWEGLSSFLINERDYKKIITKSTHEKLDYIVAGLLPPNPVEMIALPSTEDLFARLKNDYDIVVIDTTPLAQVTDAYLLMEKADLKAVVVRQGRTNKKAFSIIMKDIDLKGIENICIILNDNNIYSDQYGYGYGYNKSKMS